MRKREGQLWFYASITLLIGSVMTLFLPVISYRPANSTGRYRFTIVDLLTSGSFEELVLNDYTGHVYWDIDTGTVVVVSVIAIAALLCALIGLISLRAQYPSNMQFLLAVAGLLGTALPSVMIFVAVAMSGSGFRGAVSCGLYPIVTPIAMILTLIIVAGRFREIQQRRAAERAARGLIRQAGDL